MSELTVGELRKGLEGLHPGLPVCITGFHGNVETYATDCDHDDYAGMGYFVIEFDDEGWKWVGKGEKDGTKNDGG